MANKENKHTIEHQIINLEIEGVEEEEAINQVQQNFVYFYKEHIGKELDKAFDKIAPPDVDIQIDELNLDLGEITYVEPADLEKAIIQKVKKIVAKEVKKKMKEMEAKSAATKNKKQKFSKIGILEFFLQNGYYPNWASTDNGTVSEIFDNLANKNAKVFVQRIFQLRKDDRVRERLYQQFSIEQLTVFFKLLYGNNFQIARKQITVLKKKLGQKSEKAILSAAINYVFEGSSALGTIEYKERAFTRRVIEEVQQRKMPTKMKSKVRAGFEGAYQNIQILAYFLDHGAIPAWADVDSKKSLQDLFHNLLEHQLVKLQRMIDQNVHKPNFVQRLIFQFSTDKILELIEPTPSENIQFIKDSLKDFNFLTTTRQNIRKSINASTIRSIVLGNVVDYFFVQNKNKFVKKTFIKSTLEKLSRATQTPYDILVKESYKNVRRKKSDTAIRSTLEQLDDGLQQKLAEERTELRKAKKDYRALEKQLAHLVDKQNQGTISAQELGQLRSFSKRIKQLEKVMEELEDMDMPLEIELLIKQRQDLKNQVKMAKNQDRDKLEKRISTTEKEFKRLRSTLDKEVEDLLKNKEKLTTKVGNIAQQRIKRINNRIGKYHRAIKNVVQQLFLDQKDIEVFLANINKKLRTNITNEEKRTLRQERSRLQKELIKIEEYIQQLDKHRATLEETLQTTLVAVEEADEDHVEATRTSKLDALIFILQYGSTPWWAEKFPRQTIEELFLEFATETPEKLRKAFHEVGKYPVVWERVINQLSERGIRSVLSKLHPNNSKTIFAQAELLFTVHYSQGFESLKGTDRKKFQWGALLEYVLASNQPFNPQHFTKEVTLQTARLYNLSPSKLVEYSSNVIKNNSEQLTPLLEWNKLLANDQAVQILERDMIRFQQEQQEKEQGIYLNDQQKLELLAEFMSTGQITTRAKEFTYDRQERFEDLLLEQIQKNKKEVKDLVFNLLRLSNSRNLIIKLFSDRIFWEIVHLVRPKAVLPVQRHFKDFKKVGNNPNLDLEKDVLLNFFLSQQQENFDTGNYIKAVFIAKSQASGRSLLTLLNETKRNVKALGPGSQSSWLISILMLEVEALKYEEKQAKDMELRANLNERIDFAAKEYTDTSTKLIDILSQETAEAQGIPTKNYTLEELESMIQKHHSDLDELKKNATEGDALKELEEKRKIALYTAQLKLFKLQRPPLVRKIEQEIIKVTADLDILKQDLAAEIAKDIQEETFKEAIDLQQSLMERQIDLQKELKKESDVALKKLPDLLSDLMDEDLSHDLFIQDLQDLAKTIKSTDYQTALLDILNSAFPTVVRLEALNRSEALDPQQQALLQKFDQISPIQLWKEWEALEDYFAKNPAAYSTQKATIQQQIFKLIKRRDQKNLLGYGALLTTTQERLNNEIADATSFESLEDLQEQILVLWEQQKTQVDEMLEMTNDSRTKTDLRQLKANLDAIFTQIQNHRIKRSNAFLTADRDRLLSRQEEEETRLNELEQEKAFIIDEVKRKEAPPKAKSSMTKKKRKAKEPIPVRVEAPLQVYNAGMVLLWPYVGRLFNILGYVKGKKFVDIEAQYKAIHMLQYLINGKTQAPENELLLNKIFCNFPITQPIPFGTEFKPDDLKIAEGLLHGVIKNWPRMKTMTPNSLRGSFLIREGTIKEEDDKWILTVKKQPFDILLKTVPWGFTFIRFPWAEKFITVEWKLM